MNSFARLPYLLAATLLPVISSPAQDVSISWGPTLTLTADSLNDNSPEILISGDTVHLFWFEGDGPGGGVAYARSIDEGATFETPSRILDIGAAGGWVSPQALSFAVSGGTPRYTGTLFTLDSSSNFHNFIAMAGSAAGGSTWGPLDPVNACPGFCYTTTPGFAGHDATLYQLVTQYYVADSLLRLSVSTDGGDSWGTPVPVPSGNQPSRIRAGASVLHYVGSFPTDTTDELLYQRTTDLGATWAGSIITPAYDGFSDHPALALSGDGYVYAAWRGTLDGTPDGYAEHLSFRRSTDDGLSWDPPAIISSYPMETTVMAAGGSTVAVTWAYYATDSSSAEQVIAVSTDHGATWSGLLPMATTGWNALAVSSGYIHNAWSERVGGSGAYVIHYRRGVIGTTVNTTEDAPIPPAFSLEQNYPNPFNGTTAITYVLAARARVNLQVFNILGEPVATLVSGTEAEGAHTVRWEPGLLAAGVYYYRIQAGTLTGTNKLLYIK